MQRGDQLAAGEEVAVVETVDGDRVDVAAPAAGEVIELLASPGDFVQVGVPLVNFQRRRRAARRPHVRVAGRER